MRKTNTPSKKKNNHVQYQSTAKKERKKEMKITAKKKNFMKFFLTMEF